MNKKYILLFLVTLLPLVASAQASGGQIRRKPVNPVNKEQSRINSSTRESTTSIKTGSARPAAGKPLTRKNTIWTRTGWCRPAGRPSATINTIFLPRPSRPMSARSRRSGTITMALTAAPGW